MLFRHLRGQRADGAHRPRTRRLRFAQKETSEEAFRPGEVGSVSGTERLMRSTFSTVSWFFPLHNSVTLRIET